MQSLDDRLTLDTDKVSQTLFEMARVACEKIQPHDVVFYMKAFRSNENMLRRVKQYRNITL